MLDIQLDDARGLPRSLASQVALNAVEARHRVDRERFEFRRRLEDWSGHATSGLFLPAGQGISRRGAPPSI